MNDIREQLRQAAAALAAAAADRDTLIRNALSQGVAPKDVAADTGLSVQRISQIRHGHR